MPPAMPAGLRSRANSLRRPTSYVGAAATACGVVMALALAPVTAAQVVVGGAGLPAVEVNLWVLDALPPDGGIRKPGLRLPAAPPSALIRLRPPEAAAAALVFEPAPVAAPTPDTPGSAPAAPPPAEAALAPAGVAEPLPEPVPVRTAERPLDPAGIVGGGADPAPAPEPVRTAERPPVDPAGIVGGGAAAPAPEPVRPADRPPVDPAGIVGGGAAPAVPAAAPVSPRAVAAPVPTPPAVPPEPDVRVAALPSVLPAEGGSLAVIRFSGLESELDGAAEATLRQIAAQMGGTGRRIQLDAFAGGTPNTVGVARRLSLSRALTVRAFLIEQGIQSTRIDVRALGVPEDDGPAERVDVLLQPI